MNTANSAAALSFDDMILSQGREISRKLNLLRHENFPPDARKSMLRQFSMAEAAYFLGVSPSNLKKLHLEGKGVEPTILSGGRRAYSVEQIQELRQCRLLGLKIGATLQFGDQASTFILWLALGPPE